MILLPFAAREPLCKNDGRVGDSSVEVVVEVGVVDVEMLVLSLDGRVVVEVAVLIPLPDPDPLDGVVVVEVAVLIPLPDPDPLDGVVVESSKPEPLGKRLNPEPVGTFSTPDPVVEDSVGQVILPVKLLKSTFIHWIWFSSAKNVALQLRVASSPLATSSSGWFTIGTENRNTHE